MVVAIISDWFSEGMGYAENCLPRALAKLNCSVHTITSDLQIYATDKELYKIYEPFLGKPVTDVGSKIIDDYTLHRLHHYISGYGIGLTNLFEKLKEIKPDVVYLFEINTETTLQAVKYKPVLNYRIFAESRLHLSVFKTPRNLAQKFRQTLKTKYKWKAVGRHFEKCYPIAPDVLYVICKYFGQRKSKCSLSSLAVDTNIFKPANTKEENIKREALRTKIGFNKDDIICIYTGRFTDNKGTILLAKAIDVLHKKGKQFFKALFVGAGDEDYINDIKKYRGCTTHKFVQPAELAEFYHAADIGVWPKQESNSQLDAVACGLPIIISSKVEDIERIKDCGTSYLHNDFNDLALKIESYEDADLRNILGLNGIIKIKEFYSWDFMAKSRLNDFEKAIHS